MEYKMTLHLKVEDARRLFVAAYAHAVNVDGMASSDALEELMDEEGHAILESCLVMLLDPGSLPGAEIQMSEIERCEVRP